MRFILTAAITALEAIAIALASFSAVVVGALFMWLFPLKMAVPPLKMAQAAAMIWGLAHGVPINVNVPADAVSFMGVEGVQSFQISLIPLGFTALTVWLAIKVGLRLERGFISATIITLMASFGFFIGATAILFLSAGIQGEMPFKGAAFAALWFLIPALGGVSVSKRDSLQELLRGRSALFIFQTLIPRSLKVATGTLAALFGFASLIFAVRVLFGYPEMMRLGQMLQLDLLGEVLLFIAQLALLPLILIWIVSWLSGAGFFFGTGTEISPFAALIGPVPNIPVVALMPKEVGSWGLLALFVPFLIALLVAFTFAVLPELFNPKLQTTIAVLTLAALLIGLAAFVLGLVSSGSLGPGRMADTGVPALKFAGLLTLEVFAGLLAGFFLRKYGRPQKERSLQEQDDASNRETLRIADPQEELTKPWFHLRDKRVAKTQTSETKNAREETIQPLDLSEEQLIEEYSWESLVKDSRKPEDKK